MLAVGLWLRFDPDTADLLAENDAPDHFFIGESQNNVKAHVKCLHNSFCRFHKPKPKYSVMKADLEEF